MEKKYLAHIAGDGREQTVEAHCKQTAQYARTVLERADLPSVAYLAGLTHDWGKATTAMLEYLVKAANGEKVQKGSVNHTFAGVRYLLQQYAGSKDSYQKITVELLAYAIGAHHGLFDCIDPEHKPGFDWRLQKTDSVIEEAMRNIAAMPQAEEVTQKMPSAVSEIRNKLEEIHKLIRSNVRDSVERNNMCSFMYGLLSRLLLSAVIEGDRRDTATFMRNLPSWKPQEGKWIQGINHLESYLQDLKPTRLTPARNDISQRCKEAADLESGIYRLNVPTGGGKTLSSLRFALHHAEKWKKSRIVYVIPLLTIIEQNADVIRKALGDSLTVLEHHSNVVDTAGNGEALEQQELLAEAWDAPVIITTQVQFLNTLFSYKTTSIRRFHSLVNSIIILDEVQSVPQNMLSLFNQAVVFLREVCHATVILCSATQPCLEKAQRPIPFAPKDLIHCEKQIWDSFRRTVIRNSGNMSLAEIAEFAEEKLETCQSVLIICNKRKQAATLYHSLSGKNSECFHLSANLCIEHRRDVLKAVEEAKLHEKVILVSSQIVESGVDISFGCVIRLQAGLDNIIQAAGRCNRNGEKETPADVYVVSCVGEDLSKLETIRMGKNATQALFVSRKEDYDTNEAISQYYQYLYREHDLGYQDNYRKELKATLYDLLSTNRKYYRGSDYFLNQAFKTAAEHFTVFEENTVDVLVPYGKGEAILAELRSERAKWDTEFLTQKLKEAKPYTISVFQNRIEAIRKRHGLELLPCGALALEKEWYDSKALGLLDEPEQNFLEV